MAEYRLPHEIVYEIEHGASVSEVVESLLGTEEILTEVGPLLEACIPEITIEKITISVGEISEGSLKELVWASIFVAFQQDLEKEVPSLIDSLFNIHTGVKYPTITTVCFLLLLFYGADFAYKKISKLTEGSQIRACTHCHDHEVSDSRSPGGPGSWRRCFG